MSLLKSGHNPLLVGRQFLYSEPIRRPYSCFRLKILINSGPFFYACYNVQLFLYLLVKRVDVMLANDLDTLPAVYLVGRIRRKRIVYDSHEYFTEVPELVNRPRVQSIWRRIERRIFPHLKTVYTVNQSIANIYQELYRVKVGSFPNYPLIQKGEPAIGSLPESFAGHPVILYQGAVNVGRGLEEMIRAMVHLPEYRFLVVGGGDILDKLKGLVDTLKITDRVYFSGRVPFVDLAWYTRQAVLGISLEQDIGLNYHYSLPNKLFDYLHAGLPVLASDLPESGAIIRKVNCGVLVNRFDPQYLAETVRSMLNQPEQMELWHDNALKAAPNYTWENQELELVTTIIGS